jgi:hypothetical protein
MAHGIFSCILRYVSRTQSATSSITSSKSKVPQINPVIRPARDPEKQGARAKPSGDLVSRDQISNKLPDISRVLSRDKSAKLASPSPTSPSTATRMARCRRVRSSSRNSAETSHTAIVGLLKARFGLRQRLKTPRKRREPSL